MIAVYLSSVCWCYRQVFFYYCTMECVCRQVRQKALILADIQAFVQRRLEEDERRKNDIEELEEEMER